MGEPQFKHIEAEARKSLTVVASKEKTTASTTQLYLHRGGSIEHLIPHNHRFVQRGLRKLEQAERNRRQLVENVLILGSMLLACCLVGLITFHYVAPSNETSALEMAEQASVN